MHLSKPYSFLSIFLFLLLIIYDVNGQDALVKMKIDGAPGPLDDDFIEVVKLDHDIHTPYDARQGLPTSSKVLEFVEVTKPIDNTTPRLYNFMSKNTLIPNVEITFFKFNNTSELYEEYYKLHLEQVYIQSITTSSENTKTDINLELIKFAAQKYTWTHLESSITYSENLLSLPKINNVDLDTVVVGTVDFWDSNGDKLGDQSLIWYFNHEVSIPTSQQQLTGSRVIYAFEFVKDLNMVSPILVKAICNNETFEKVEINLHKYFNGAYKPYFQFILEQVKFVRNTMSYSEDYYVGDIPILYRELNQIIAQKFTWTDIGTGETHSENWLIPTASSELKDKIRIKSYPNPFNSTTNVQLSIPENYLNKKIEILLFDINGRVVKKVLNGLVKNPEMDFIWDGTNDNNVIVPSGNYFYRVLVGDLAGTGKLSYVK